MTANNIWQWFQENEASTGGVTDKIQNYLTAAGYTGATNEALYRWLGARGYEGSLADRIYQFEYFNTFRYIDISAKLVLEKFGTDAHVWIPGIGYFNGLQAGNYIDSAGTQAGLVDNPVGLVMDAEGSLGAELVTNGDFSNGTTGWTSTGSATIANLNGELEVTGSASTDRAIQIVNLTAGKTYFVSGYARAGTSTARSIIFYSSGFTNNLTFNLVSGNVSGYFTPSVTGAGQIWLRVDVGTAYFDNISVREVTGAITAARGTTANKPILRRGAVNLLTNSVLAGGTSGVIGSGAVAPTGWIFPAATGKVTYSGQTTRFEATAQRPFIGIGIAANTAAYILSARIESGSSSRIDDVIGVSAGTAVISAITFKKNNVSVTALEPVSAGDIVSALFTVTTAGSPQFRIGLGCSGTSTGDITMSSPQLELGSTASEYIPTTTAAASSSSGNYYWQFDGSNDSLALSSVPFQMADDHCVIAGARLIASGASRFLFSPAAQPATSQAIAAINADTNGNWAVAWRDDAANVGTVFAAAGALPVGSIGVISGIKTGNNKKLRINGAQSGSTNTTVMGATTVSVGYIGADRNSGQNFLGSIYPVIAIKGTVSDADLLVLERWVGSLSGVSI